MKKLLLFFILFYPLVSFATIDERKIDVYYANGMMASKESADKSTRLLRNAIADSLYGGNTSAMKKQVGKVTTAYNTTNDFLSDVLESLLQKIGWVGLTALFNQNYQTDIDKQVDAYKESIASGHKVLAVAHSQGNLFTKDAYDLLDPWMQGYFEAISVASSMGVDIKPGTPYIDWDNDLVPKIRTGGGSVGGAITSSARKVNWILQNNPLNHSIG